MLNLYQLHLFVAVADAGSFSEAARRLHMTQPAVSMAVAALEKGVGGGNERLFDRRGQRVELTALGHQLLPAARQLLAQAEQTEQALHAGRGVLAGRLRLGSAGAAGAVALARLLGAFGQAYPQVQTSLAVDDPNALLDQLRAGDLDAALLPERARGRTLEHALLITDEWVIVVPPHHPWQRGAQVGPAAAPADLPLIAPDRLREQPLVCVGADLRPGLSARRELPAVLEERGVPWRELRVALELPTDLAVLIAVAAGAGIGLVSRLLLAEWPGSLGCFRLRGGPLARQFHLTRDRRIPPTPAAATWWTWATERAMSDERKE
jgi:DNA-binding transcriptional LysR family regulator